MWTLLTVLGCSFLLGLILTPAARALRRALWPGRSAGWAPQDASTAGALTGGIAVFLSACTALATASLWSRWLGDRLAAESGGLLGLLLARPSFAWWGS